MKNIILSIILLLLLNASGQEGENLINIEDNLVLKGKKIAVIAGTGNEDNVILANVLTKELKRNSCLEVLTEKEIVKKIGDYPEDIPGPYNSNYDNYYDIFKENYTKADTAKLLEIRKKLGVDYIYAVWIPLTSARIFSEKTKDSGNSSSDKIEIEEMWVLGQLFNSKKAEYIGRSNFKIPIKKSGYAIGNLPGSKKEAIQMKCEELAIELDDKLCAEYRKESSSLKEYEKKAVVKPGIVSKKLEYKSIGNIEFAYIKGGAFLMGSPKGRGEENEYPIHKVLLDPFYLSKFEVTQKQYADIMGTNPSAFKGDDLPVESVSWNDAGEFCRKFGKKYNVRLRLPYEAEWEYACRAGSSTKYYWGNIFSVAYCWNKKNSYNQIHPAGSKKSNAWGLYDMNGNVWEWCMDWYHHGYYRTLPEKNPKGPDYGSERVVRGGSWNDDAEALHSADRDSFDPDLTDCITGFRVAIPVK